MKKNTIVKSFEDYVNKDYVNEEVAPTTSTMDSNLSAIQNSNTAFTKYQGKITGMFANAKSTDMEKISKDFESFITSLPENEKGGSDMLRILFSSEKIKFDIKSLQQGKIDIDTQIQQRTKELQDISAKLK